jgi:hypothetical protein
VARGSAAYGDDVTAYLRHRAHPDDKWGTACGASWQGWQAPPGLTLSSVTILPPHSDPIQGDDIRVCAACVRAKHTGTYRPRDRAALLKEDT